MLAIMTTCGSPQVLGHPNQSTAFKGWHVFLTQAGTTVNFATIRTKTSLAQEMEKRIRTATARAKASENESTTIWEATADQTTLMAKSQILARRHSHNESRHGRAISAGN